VVADLPPGQSHLRMVHPGQICHTSNRRKNATFKWWQICHQVSHI
jgi:hypothetical protein